MRIVAFWGLLLFLSSVAFAQAPSSPDIPKRVFVSAKRAAIYGEPSITSQVLTHAPFKKVLIVYAWEDRGEWCLVRYRNIRGWVRVADVLPAEVPATKVDGSTRMATSPPAQTIVLGNPSKATSDVAAPDNYLLFHNGYILSYNRSRGAANWVTWHLSGSDIGSIERTNAFAADESLPTDWQIGAEDYVRSGYDRGHMCPSKDRTDTDEHNRETFLMSNMQPQIARLNRSTWQSLEREVQDQAQSGSEAYLYAGCYGDKGKINGKVSIPTRCWKIAVMLPEGKNDKRRLSCGTRIIAVDMPNESTIVSGWRNYKTRIDAIEAATGYNFLSTLSKSKQACLESKTDDQ